MASNYNSVAKLEPKDESDHEEEKETEKSDIKSSTAKSSKEGSAQISQLQNGPEMDEPIEQKPKPKKSFGEKRPNFTKPKLPHQRSFDKNPPHFTTIGNGISQNANIIINNNISTEFDSHLMKEKTSKYKEESVVWSYNIGKKKTDIKINEFEIRKSTKVRDRSASLTKRSSEESKPNEFMVSDLKRFSSISSERHVNGDGENVSKFRLRDSRMEIYQDQRLSKKDSFKQYRQSFEGNAKLPSEIKSERAKKGSLSEYNSNKKNKMVAPTANQNLLQSSSFKKKRPEILCDYKTMLFNFTLKKADSEKKELYKPLSNGVQKKMSYN